MNDAAFKLLAATGYEGQEAARLLAAATNSKVAFYDEEHDGYKVWIADTDGTVQAVDVPPFDEAVIDTPDFRQANIDFEAAVLSSNAVPIIRYDETWQADSLADLVTHVLESTTPP